MASGNRVVLTFHLVSFSWNIFGVYQNVQITDLAEGHGAHTYGGRWKYLTFINQILQTIYFGVCLLSDIAQLLNTEQRKNIGRCLLQLQDFMFSILAFPVGTFVVFSFWSIYTYDRELVYPKVLDTIIPQWLNHCMHTTVLPLLLIELAVCSHHYPSKRKGLLALSIFCFAYITWVLWIHFASEIWVYPILAQLNTVGKAIFFALSFLVMALLYFLGEFLTKQIWNYPEESNKRK